jgi:hypothetical protein
VGEVNVVAILVAVLGAGGAGAFAREVVDIVSKVRRGVSTRESNRKNDIIAQRDAAVRAAEEERRQRIAWQEYSGALRYQLRENGHNPNPLPDDVEDTLNPRS